MISIWGFFITDFGDLKQSEELNQSALQQNVYRRRPVFVMNNDEVSQPYPINGILDLHTFQPGDLGSLIPHYIEVCLEKEIYRLRIIHGKGTGNLRRSVHALLERNEHVANYGLAGDRSGWGATLVQLKK